MKKLAIKTEVSFDSAHRLTFHEGKCKNLHGHTWRVIIELAQDLAKAGDMLVDFGLLKKAIQDKFDHKVIAFSSDVDLIAFCESMGFDLIVVDFEPTAENLTKYIANMLVGMCESMYDCILSDLVVEVFETPKSSAKITYF